MKWIESLFILLFTIPANVFTYRCSRYPSNTFTPKSPVDENFGISITGNAQTYILGQTYNVSLQAYNGHRFISAKVVLENENGENSFDEDLGHLHVVDPIETRYSQQCVNTIESTNTNPKTRLDMVWVAPTEPGNGCVLIRATLLQHRDVWYMDDGGLTKRICEEVVDNLESQKKDLTEKSCCACDEARYELIFEGLWSRNLHPKDFPSSGWLTRFTDILGAAHTSDYRFWDNGVLASPEMKLFAEHGSSQGLEREFNQYFSEGKIRTVIKARGPAFPYINIPSVASVRVDPLHHQISIASKIVPSPDWIVGIPGLELCFANCTWLEEKVINLYPWDIGTDAGPSYTSPDQPQFPADVVRRMSSEYPADHRSPFFDETHAPMKHFATLTIKRQRVYERKCKDEESNNLDSTPRECFTHPWSNWSECTAKCGKGRQYRTRVYKQPDIAKIYNCDNMVKRKQDQECYGEKCLPVQGDFDNGYQMGSMEENEETFEFAMPQISVKAAKTKAECRVGNWSPWLQCNATCGNGMMESTREYVIPYNERECQEVFYVNLKKYKKCVGKNCLGHIANFADDNMDHTDNNFNYNSNSPEYNGNLRTQTSYKTYQPYNRAPEYVNTRKLSEPNSDEEPVEQEHNLQAEDLRQESIEADYTRTYSNPRPKEPFNIRPAYQKSGATMNHKIEQNYGTNHQNPFQEPPAYCYQSLNVIHNCNDPRVVGNFWFYNYCTDECMLYATDICDNNRNKFLSLEQCEQRCATPMRSSKMFFKQKQTQGCRRAVQRERNFKKRRDFSFA